MCASLLISSASCIGGANVLPGPTPLAAVHMPAAVDLTEHGFSVHLDPTLMLWARDAHVDVRRVVRDAVTTIESEIHGPPTAIAIAAGSFKMIPDIGIGGTTDVTTGTVRIELDSSRVPLSRLLRVWLPFALAHELHHSKRITDGPGYGTTLLEAIVTEGTALAFCHEVYPDAPRASWTQPLSRDERDRILRRLRTRATTPMNLDVQHDWFYGADGLPRYAGYRLGFAMASAYLRSHPHATAPDLVTVDASVIARGSGYGL